MIAFVRKCLTSKHNSFVCKYHVSLSLSLQFFSTSRERILVKGPRVYDLLVFKYQFSPEVASLVASDLSRFRSPERANSTLSFLKESGFSSTQLQKIVKYRPRILTASVEDGIKLKIKIFQDLELSPEDIAKVISNQMSILDLSAKNRIIPSLSLLEDLLGSNHDVAKLLTRCARFLSSDLEKTLVPNVAILKSCGISMQQIRILLYNSSRCLLIKPDIMRESVDKAIELGFSQSSRMLVCAVRVITSLSKDTWEVKWQAFQNLGFSDSDIMTMFKKVPIVFHISMKKVEKIKELLLATGKFNISSITCHPTSLTYSIENRYKPRLQTLGILESKNLIEKWPTLATICTLSDDKFFQRFIRPYLNEVGEVHAASQEQSEMKLQASA